MSPVPFPRRALALLAAACATLAVPALAQSWPDRPIKLVVPFPAGGPTDIVARPLGEALSKALGQPVVIDNRGGAGGSVGAELVAKSTADGYTLLMGTVGTNAINGALYSKLPYDPVRDFTPIALVASSPVALVVNVQSPHRTTADYVGAARAKPGQVTYGSAGNGTPGHLTGQMFATAAQVKLQHVPYKGSAPALVDLLGGQIDSMFDPVQSVISHVKAQKLRALCVTGKERSAALRDVPTCDESGVRGTESRAWWAVFGPARMPQAAVDKLRTEIEKITRGEPFTKALAEIGVQANADVASLAEFQKAEVERWQKAVRDSGAKAE